MVADSVFAMGGKKNYTIPTAGLDRGGNTREDREEKHEPIASGIAPV